MELNHYQCPNCGASLNVSEYNTEIKCEYCGQSFIIDDPNVALHEAEMRRNSDNRMKMTLILSIVLFIGLTTIALVLFSTLAPNGFGNDEESSRLTTSVDVPMLYDENI